MVLFCISVMVTFLVFLGGAYSPKMPGSINAIKDGWNELPGSVQNCQLSHTMKCLGFTTLGIILTEV